MKTRRKVIGLLAVSLLAAITGCSSQENDSSRVKNAALDRSPVLVNSAFVSGAGGWTLDKTSSTKSAMRADASARPTDLLWLPIVDKV